MFFEDVGKRECAIKALLVRAIVEQKARQIVGCNRQVRLILQDRLVLSDCGLIVALQICSEACDRRKPRSSGISLRPA